jgi:hypothetical protein
VLIKDHMPGDVNSPGDTDTDILCVEDCHPKTHKDRILDSTSSLHDHEDKGSNESQTLYD